LIDLSFQRNFTAKSFRKWNEMAYGKGRSKTDLKRMADLGQTPMTPEIADLHHLCLLTVEEMARAVWPGAITDPRPDGKEMDATILLIQWAAVRCGLSSVWAEKMRLLAKPAVTEQWKRAQARLFGRLKHVSARAETPAKDGSRRLLNLLKVWTSSRPRSSVSPPAWTAPATGPRLSGSPRTGAAAPRSGVHCGSRGRSRPEIRTARIRNKELGRLARAQKLAMTGSRRWRRLLLAKNALKARIRRQVRDLRHKATRQLIDFCVEVGAAELFIGDPRGVRRNRCGRKHNQCICQWEMGTDLSYLEEKARKAGIRSFSGDERGTSSTCPGCGHRQELRGRDCRCRSCGFTGHRDVVGAVNMFPLAFGTKVPFPRPQDVTYLQPGPVRRARRAVVAQDTGPAAGNRRRRFTGLPDGPLPAGGVSPRSRTRSVNGKKPPHL
jgi:IS605 OrfB family transposase